MPHHPDPFREARQDAGVLPCEFQGDTIPMILRQADEHVENEARYQRFVGYDSLSVTFAPR